MKCISNKNLMDADVMIHGDTCKININVAPFTANIREETLFRLLAFFSNSHKLPSLSHKAQIGSDAPDPTKNNNLMYIEYFNICPININLNYYPLIVKDIGSNILTIKDYKVNLSSQTIRSVSGFDKLITFVSDKWKSDVNPNNILQFIPNIKVIQPYATPIVRIFNLTSRYFRKSQNKKKIRGITKGINKGISIVSNIMKTGIENIWDIF